VAGFAATLTVGFVGRMTEKGCETRRMQRHIAAEQRPDRCRGTAWA